MFLLCNLQILAFFFLVSWNYSIFSHYTAKFGERIMENLWVTCDHEQINEVYKNEVGSSLGEQPIKWYSKQHTELNYEKYLFK